MCAFGVCMCADILIKRYEAVHPVLSLSELKRRLGRGRRCFAFFHPCLPGEPLVFVHVALLPDMAGSMEDIRGRGRSGRRDGEEQRGLEDGEEGGEEDQARQKKRKAKRKEASVGQILVSVECP